MPAASFTRRATFLLSNRTRATRHPLFSIVSHPPLLSLSLIVSRRFSFDSLLSSPDTFPILLLSSFSPLFSFLFPLFLSLPPLRRLAINHGAVHERCSRSNRSLSLSLFHSPRFLLLPVVAIYFTSLRRYRKLFAALASTGGHPRGIRSADHPRGEREIGRVKISRVPRPRDYGISGPMVIYDGPRREGKKKRYSNEHASSNRYILSSSSSSAFSPRARLSTPAHGSGADSQPPCR